MPRVPPTDFKDGDALEPWHMNFIFAFIRRWLKFDASAPLNFDGSSESPPHLSLGDIDDLVPVLTPSGGITAGTYSSPTSGTVQLLIEYEGGPGFTTSGTNTVTAYNCFATAVPDSVFGWARWRGPYLYLVDWDCGS